MRARIYTTLAAAQNALEELGVDSVGRPLSYIFKHPYLEKWAIPAQGEEVNALPEDWFFNVMRNPPPVNAQYAIVIPEKFQWCFPIKIGVFEIPLLEDKNGKKVVTANYLQWMQFRTEFEKPINSEYRLALLPIWQYAQTVQPILYEPKP